MVAPLDPANAPDVSTWTVSCMGLAPSTVLACNWLVALGRGMESMGVEPARGRLAAEVLPNGVIIANDLETGRRYVVCRGSVRSPSAG